MSIFEPIIRLKNDIFDWDQVYIIRLKNEKFNGTKCKIRFIYVGFKDTINYPEKSDENKSFSPNQSAHYIFFKIELCYFSLDQLEIRIHLL